MSSPLSRMLHVLALAILIVGCIFVILSAFGSTRVNTSFGGHVTSPENVPLFVLGLVLVILPVLFIAVYWVMRRNRVQR